MSVNAYKEVYDLRHFGDSIDIVDLIKNLVSSPDIDDNSFFVADLDEVYNRHLEWKDKFPRIEPLFAVKSNYDCFVIRLLSHLGIGFDCSSQGEIETLLKHNISPKRILFANPCKHKSHINYAYRIGVNKLVFDNEHELVKIHENHPNAECLLRIKCSCLPSKFGADIKTAISLIKKSIELNVKLTGISFYVGFRQTGSKNIVESILNARYLFDYAKENFGFVMNILDIGGGFPGTWQSKQTFITMATEINQILDKYFPIDLLQSAYNHKETKLKIIAELGTYYTCSAYTLCVNIIAKKVLDVEHEFELETNNSDARKILINGNKNSLVTDLNLGNECLIDTGKKILYYVNDSIHASFKWYSLSEGLPIFATSPAKTKRRNGVFFESSICGATCDSGDFILRDCFMPELFIGEFLIFRNMGSYTKTCAVPFNDIRLPETIYVSTKMWDVIKHAYLDPRSNENVPTKEDFQNTLTAREILNRSYETK